MKILLITNHQEKTDTYKDLLGKNFEFESKKSPIKGNLEDAPEEVIKQAKQHFEKHKVAALVEHEAGGLVHVAVASPFGIMTAEGETTEEAFYKIEDFLRELTRE
jgi:hypothetical protein